ncbi:GNAT family N-acetyltransferase [Granulicella sp. 5B5]|uniref:GNAT family N-acetyltransferase n=1 Tax=Granulicella sp. 5B5 TaxID=1617967 RepID=UPI0015F70624|nr:GNAT family N-acetyltransferase [Granulicella sp. 5B5]QMV19294.1 GNAT family N-acetyltransferase [Granulicella sp. 5B5]
MTTIRPATPADVPTILRFIRDLALYEREPDSAIATEADLLRDGFCLAPDGITPLSSPRRFDCLIAEHKDDVAEGSATPVGFALYFASYSTWLGHHGLYLEDLYVSPEHRGSGLGRALLARVAAIALEQGCGRLEWSILDWNQPSIDFYHRIGAVMKSEWLGMRITGNALTTLAASTTT